jgi:hypothetical protein
MARNSPSGNPLDHTIRRLGSTSDTTSANVRFGLSVETSSIWTYP